MAFAITTAQRGQDDALEHFDRLHGDLLLRAAAAGKRERLRDGEAIERRWAHPRAGRASVLLETDTISESLRDAVFAAGRARAPRGGRGLSDRGALRARPTTEHESW